MRRPTPPLQPHRFRTIRANAPYLIDLPGNVEHADDEKCASYWVPGSEVALQICSYVRAEGPQLGAWQRMAARLARGGRCQPRPIMLGIPGCDRAAITLTDPEGTQWIHAYLVWPDLAVYATISGRPEQITGRDAQWAIEALRSVRPAEGRRPPVESHDTIVDDDATPPASPYLEPRTLDAVTCEETTRVHPLKPRR